MINIRSYREKLSDSYNCLQIHVSINRLPNSFHSKNGRGKRLKSLIEILLFNSTQVPSKPKFQHQILLKQSSKYISFIIVRL